MNQAVTVGFVIYLLLILIVGIVTARFNKTLPDFLLAGRSLGPWVVALSERASGQSGWLILGLTGLAYATGLGDPSGMKFQPALWAAIGGCSGVILSWILIAERLRVESEKLGALTLPRFFELKFRGEDALMRFVTTGIIVFCFIFYIAAQFDAAGKSLEQTFGFSQYRYLGRSLHHCVLYFDGRFSGGGMDGFRTGNNNAGDFGCSAFGGFTAGWWNGSSHSEGIRGRR